MNSVLFRHSLRPSGSLTVRPPERRARAAGPRGRWYRPCTRVRHFFPRTLVHRLSHRPYGWLRQPRVVARRRGCWTAWSLRWWRIRSRWQVRFRFLFSWCWAVRPSWRLRHSWRVEIRIAVIEHAALRPSEAGLASWQLRESCRVEVRIVCTPTVQPSALRRALASRGGSVVERG